MKCQVYANNIHVAPSDLHNLTSPWPFACGAASYASVTKSIVVKFIKRDIICRYDLLAHIIMDNGTNLNNKMKNELCEQFKIKHYNSTPYHPKMNAPVETTNKNIKKIVQKMVVTIGMTCYPKRCTNIVPQYEPP
ncbi:hypothetical protein CR513_36191, partial [Mucuna pruriens]